MSTSYIFIGLYRFTEVLPVLIVMPGVVYMICFYLMSRKVGRYQRSRQ
jgi:hypothetical protein